MGYKGRQLEWVAPTAAAVQEWVGGCMYQGKSPEPMSCVMEVAPGRPPPMTFTATPSAVSSRASASAAHSITRFVWLYSIRPTCRMADRARGKGEG